jgi:flavin reductase (DIM6/NTAB) family NADH-FMN oxidoreductase RutF
MKKSLGAQTLTYTAPVWVIGTYDQDGVPNAMTAAWGGICCSKPPCVAVSLQEIRYSFTNLKEKMAFTVNIPGQDHVREADYFGIVSGKKLNKFAATGLTPVASELVDAPYIREFPVVLECKVIHVIKIGLHTQFVGEILDVKAEESVLGPEGAPLIELVKPFIFDIGARSYRGVGDFLGKAFSIGNEIALRK